MGGVLIGDIRSVLAKKRDTLWNMYTCSKCGASFTRSDNLRRHERSSCNKIHDGPPGKLRKMDSQPSTSTAVQPSTSTVMIRCDCCNIAISANRMSSHLRTLEHRNNSCVPLMDGVQVIQSAFNCRIVSYRIHSENHHIDYVMFFNEIRNKILNLLEEVIRIHKTVKVNMETFGRYILHTQDISDIKAFNTTNRILDQSTNLNSILDIFVDAIITQASEFQERDSGMVIYIIFQYNIH